MPLYEYKCDCGRAKEQLSAIKDCTKHIECECGQSMQRIISLPNTNIVNNVRYSSTMGCNPKQIPAMMRKYPGSRYTPDGRLEVNSRKDKLIKMKQRGMTESE